MIRTWIALRKAGLLGINERNLRLVNDLNPRRLMRLVNDKTETKRLAIDAGIATPELYGLIRNPLDNAFSQFKDGKAYHLRRNLLGTPMRGPLNVSFSRWVRYGEKAVRAYVNWHVRSLVAYRRRPVLLEPLEHSRHRARAARLVLLHLGAWQRIPVKERKPV